MVLMATGLDGDQTPRYRETQDGFWRLQLITEVRSNGIYVRFAPMQQSFRSIPFDEIEAVTCEQYSAVDYGGWHWGIRISPTGNYTVYRITGDAGVELRLMNGKRIFIGSQRTEELKNAIIAGERAE